MKLFRFYTFLIYILVTHEIKSGYEFAKLNNEEKKTKGMKHKIQREYRGIVNNAGLVQAFREN
jgi:uncharacterized membrane protein